MSSITSALSSTSADGATDERARRSSEQRQPTQALTVSLSAAGEADLPRTLVRLARLSTPADSDRMQILSPGLVEAFRANVTVKDRTYRLRRYKACFTGIDAVRTLIAIGAAQTIEEALTVGNNLVADHVIEHVFGEHCLKNENLFYRFVEPDKAPMKRTLTPRQRSPQY
ncbi:hypothetical protein MMPV_007139 [Pyropia vietnamensis]